MCKYGSLILVFISLVFFSCESTENSVTTSEQNEITALNSVNPNDVIVPQTFSITKNINGVSGGTITIDTTYTDNNGKSIYVSLNLTFDPNSFSGTKIISVTPEPSTASIQFSPAMIFNKPVKLNLNYTGVDLNALGFTSNSKVDFVYMNNNGNIEYILKDEVKIKIDKNQIYTKKALLPHFSRYAFVRKSF